MSVFLDACARKPTSHTPIWLMRQAGRYQAEYRAIREKVSFIELCKTPDLAAEVTLLPIAQFGFDAAIIFADILLILEPLGVPFHFAKDHGPVVESPIRSTKDIDAIHNDSNPEEDLHFVMEAIKKVRAGLPHNVPLLGFAGAPFTLASYIIEGGSSKNYLHTKELMYTDEGAWAALMTKITDATAAYLRAQVKAGAQAIQVFDSWAGCLSPDDYKRYVMPSMQRLFAALPENVPAIHFSTGNSALYPLMHASMNKANQQNVIGIDWRTDLRKEWDRLGSDTALMGNLDPASFFAPREVLIEKAKSVLDKAAGQQGHIFNLGHGILPKTSPDQVRALVEFVKEESAKR